MSVWLSWGAVRSRGRVSSELAGVMLLDRPDLIPSSPAGLPATR